jgi:ribosomal protein S18 acetylase RimI-like enzyme
MSVAVLIVRPFEPHEWPLYRELRLAGLREAPDAFGSTLEREQAFPEELWMTRLAAGAASPIDRPLVAEYAGRAAGLCWVRIDPNDESTAALYQVWVHPDARRRGIGQRLLESAMLWARDAGARVMVLSVSTGRASAMDLYRRAGFVAVGLPTQLRPDSALLQQHMQCSLAESSAGA